MSGSVLSVARVVGSLVLFILSSSWVLADDAVRKATALEQQFHRSMQELLAASLPADTPEGWEVSGQTEMTDLEYIAIGKQGHPLTVEYYLEWTNASQQQQAQEAALAKISEVTATPLVSDEQIQEYEQLAAEIAEAAAAGETEEVERLRQEMEREAAVINKAFAAVDEKIAEINRTVAATDAYAGISVIANRLYQPLETEAEQLVVAGYPAFRSKGFLSSSGEWQEGSTMVFLGGRWVASAGGSAFQFKSEKGLPPARLQSVVVWIEADPKRAESIAGLIDWQALQAALDE